MTGVQTCALPISLAAEKATGLSDDDWWTARSPLLDEMVDKATWATRYPTLTRISEEQAFDQTDRPAGDDTPYTVREALDTFEFGLQRVLDGVELFIASRSGSGSGSG